MKDFEHVDAGSIESALNMLAVPGSVIIAGGTDLLPRMKIGITSPRRLVNLKTVPGMDAIASGGTGTEIGTLASLKDIAADGVVQNLYPALVQAIARAASPQLRNRGTIGGNLIQASRCWYYRGGFNCWLKGGDICFARDGENRRHAIFGSGPCFTVHPSDPAVALMALDARLDLQGSDERRTLPLRDFFQFPVEASRQLTSLGRDEIITSVFIPSPPRGTTSAFIKAMERRVWAFAQASLAVSLGLESGIIRHARLVAGGVAQIPWRLYGVEKVLMGAELNGRSIKLAADAAVESAVPLPHNAYKVTLLRGLVEKLLSGFADNTPGE